ncbi:hypothetical protein Cgig2_034071 [Carnegiea gigantea]|uniref:Uncharacterized protein n=1 Tax=Carnegiea gigantea TaxID=171969 RepID=A0A9Q1Q414_9CARY|nr:hypothetical protein Cgig2_034071 [Carnegiea gigantea]
MEIMFSNTFGTVNKNGRREGEGEDEVLEEEENIEVIRTVRTEDSGYNDCGVPNISLENIKEGKEKPIKRIKSKVGTAVGMQSRLDPIVEAGESYIPHFIVNSVSNNLPNCSIAECMSLVKILPSIGLRSELYELDARLFIKRQYREICITLEDGDVRVAWLEDELELIK